MLRKKVYKRCFDGNSDGAGFAYWNEEKNTWSVQKGFMTFKHWWKAFNRHEFTVDDIVISHFRIGTSGNRKGPDCTHPFPITDDFEKMRVLEYDSDNIVFHNGVIGIGKDENSDTMLGIVEYVVPLWPHIEEKGITEILGEVLEDTKCRWLITEKDQVYLYGRWKKNTEHTGYYFSNDNYKPAPVYNYSSNNWRNRGSNGVYRSGSLNGTGRRQTTMFIRSSHIAKDFYDYEDKWNWSLWEEQVRKDRLEISEAIYSNKKADDKASDEMARNAGLLTSEDIKYLTDPNWDKDDDDELDGNTTIVSPHEPPPEDFPVTVTGLLDNHGNIIWDDKYDEDSDLPCCPSCGGEDLEESQLLNGDTACKDCGAIFEMSTGDVILYDPSIIVDQRYVECPVCTTVVRITEWGECPMCAHIIDHKRTTDMIAKQHILAKKEASNDS